MPWMPKLAAKRRVLGRDAMLLQGRDDGIEFCLADDSLGKGAMGNVCRRIIKAVERTKTAVTIDPGYAKSA